MCVKLALVLPKASRTQTVCVIYVHEFCTMKAEYDILSSRLSTDLSFKTVELFRGNSI